ncbi:MAG TPA: fatty acid--CoA ligase family protein [Mycobacteriales bacterium]|nr:fatty acid--CoA ligase family protein [Mycobacteriales bacterium]
MSSLDLRTVADDLFLRAVQRPALVEADATWTYGELAAAVRAAAARLRAAGVGVDDRVYVIAGPGRLALTAAFAALRLGATPALINPRLTTDEVATLVDLAGKGAAVVVEPQCTDRAEALPMPAIGMELLESTTGDDRPGDGVAADGLVLFTSGTTGLPKPVPVPWQTLTARLAPYVEVAQPQMRLLCVPLHHVGGLIGSMVCLLGGHSLAVQSRFDAGEWLRLIEQHRVELTFMVPTMLARVVDHPDLATTDLSSLQMITYGASPMSGELVERLTAAMPHVGLVNTFGQTETLGGITFTTPEDAHDPVHRESVGRLVPGVEIRIVTPGGDEEVEPGQVGELLVKSSQNVVDGWLRTGDLVRVDADGYLYPNGRLSDTINRGGEKFGPVEVEAALRTHPLVTDCAVAGIPDPEMNERVGAVVVSSEPVDAATLQQWCAERIAKYKTPEIIVFADEVPLTDMSKVDRKAVVRMVTGGN